MLDEVKLYKQAITTIASLITAGEIKLTCSDSRYGHIFTYITDELVKLDQSITIKPSDKDDTLKTMFKRRYSECSVIVNDIKSMSDGAYEQCKNGLHLSLPNIESHRPLTSNELLERFMDVVGLTYICPSCSSRNIVCDTGLPIIIGDIDVCCVKRVDELEKNEELVNYKFVYFSKSIYDDLMSGINTTDNDTMHQELIMRYTNKYNKNRNNVMMVNPYTLKCRHRHVAKLKSRITLSQLNDELICPICTTIKDTEFFNLLNELGVLYTIHHQDLPNSVIPRGISLKQRNMLQLIVYTHNKKGHLTGKIVFIDPDGREQAKANSNNLVYRWMDFETVNDRGYCKKYLHDYFSEIKEKYKLK